MERQRKAAHFVRQLEKYIFNEEGTNGMIEV